MVLMLALGLIASDGVSAAVQRSLLDRMGDVQVVVRQVSTVVKDQPGLVATIEPGARLGQPIRFVLSADGKRIGSVVASVMVAGEAVVARRSIARDEQVGAADVTITRAEIKNVFVRRMPTEDDIVGTRARRDISAGELLTPALVVVPPAVRSGDQVRVVVTMGPVQVSGEGRASGSGQVGDRIRVLTPSSRKPLNARITGRGAVEIVQ